MRAVRAVPRRPQRSKTRVRVRGVMTSRAREKRGARCGAAARAASRACAFMRSAQRVEMIQN